ncbi:BLUF domain-containing protein [Pleionea sediminis]|uniref:BLUF domain-containing protein n=1 Tax=Pleionea sediminis TaxID=2569479 RepID=UPI001186D2BC|nr:BLUF domain-containing protein [Pleionea sediminis]
MISLTYSSTYTGKPENFRADLADIYKASLQNNCRHGISGVLIHNNQHFLQTIEGEPEDVENLMRIISQDKRHSDVKILIKEECSSRQYNQWNMQPINLAHPSLFNTENIEKLTKYMKHLIELDTEGFHSLLRELLNEPNINEILQVS